MELRLSADSLRVRVEQTEFGSIALVGADSIYQTTRPLVMMIAGALRDSKTLSDWPRLLQAHADVVVAELPGHGHSPDIAPATFEAIVRIFDAVTRSTFAGREMVIVGESLGGLVGIALATLPGRPQKAVIAVDPPMTTAKLWSVAPNLRSVIRQNPHNVFLRSFAENVFGIGPSSTSERIYYSLLGQVKIPVHIVTGDMPLMPPRQVEVPPCIFDDVDKYVVETFFRQGIEVHRIKDCGHLLLNEKKDECLRIIVDVIASVRGATPA